MLPCIQAAAPEVCYALRAAAIAAAGSTARRRPLPARRAPPTRRRDLWLWWRLIPQLLGLCNLLLPCP